MSLWLMQERLELIFELVESAPPVATAEQARLLFAQVMSNVETQYSGVQNHAGTAASRSDGRMYPPLDDAERGSTESVRRFRTKGHYILFGRNGAIRVETLLGICVFEKCGADGLPIERA
jgi:plasmid stabilization system protein ParE